MPPRQITLIVSIYNRPDALAKVLAGLDRQTMAPGELLFSDDGSGPPTRDLVGQWSRQQSFPALHFWHEDAGFRKTIILNQSVAAAQGDYLVFLDGDCVPHSRFLADHARLAERGCWVQGRRCFVPESHVSGFDSSRTSWLLDILSGRIRGIAKSVRVPIPIFRRDTRQRGILGCNMAVWREDLVAINGFDEEYTGWGIGEDSDMGTRLYHLGRKRKFVYGHAVVYHLNHPEARKDHVSGSLARLQHTIRSGKIRCDRGLDRHLPLP